MTSRSAGFSFRSRAVQAGLSLIVSLLFLFILTILGLAGARVAVMQERMAGNVNEYNLAFQAAEATLREIELKLKNYGTGTIGLSVIRWEDIQAIRNDCTLENKAGADWASWEDAPWQTAPDTGNDYLVISISAVSGIGDDLSPPCMPPSSPSEVPVDDAFIIAARATGPAGAADVIVQSIFYWARP